MTGRPRPLRFPVVDLQTGEIAPAPSNADTVKPKPARPRGRQPDTRFDHPAGFFGPRQRPRACGRERLLRPAPGRDAGAGRRIRLRQVDDRPFDHRLRSRAGGAIRIDGAMCAAPASTELREHPPPCADDLPGPVREPQSAHPHRRRHRRADPCAWARHRPRRRRERVADLLERVGLSPGWPIASRMNSPAASASASASRARSRSSRS
jgi:peptide/nickel transport system ATP-binding protein